MANLNDVLSMVDEFEELVATAAKEKKKLDPKAEVRNKKDPVVPAGRAKDHKDHYPLGSIEQGRNALARVMQYTKCPPWWKGSLKSLQEAVSRKVHSKYPSIGKDKKKSSALNVDHLLAKYGESAQAFYNVIRNYENGSDTLKDFAEGMKIAAQQYAKEANLDDPKDRKVYDVLLREASLVLDVMPEMNALDREMYSVLDGTEANGDEEIAEASMKNMLAKYGSVESVLRLMNSEYSSTYALLYDIAKAQFAISGLNHDEEPSDEDQETYEESKKLHDIIMECAAKLKPIEEGTAETDNKSDVKSRILSAFDQLNKGGFGHNQVGLWDLRPAVGATREEFDTAMNELRREGILTLSGHEGRFNQLTPEQQASGIHSATQNLVYAARRR